MAPSLISPRSSCPDLVSMVVPRLTAAWRAALTCTAVRAVGAWISQPAGTIVSCSALTAPSVMTVFGTEVPAGSLLTTWTTGFWMHIPPGQGVFGGCVW